jgi:hypothetical protein
MDAVFKQQEMPRIPKPSMTELQKFSCTHCCGDFHEGGSAKCDLKDLPTKAARLAAKRIDARISAGETDKAKVIKEATEAHT